MKRFVAMGLLLVGANGALAADAIDYGDPDTWLCRPDQIDMHLAMGDLVNLVRSQGAAHLAE